MQIGSHLILLAECGSTNTVLSDLAKRKDLPSGTVLYTWNQTRGRGQRNQQWIDAEHQSLALSVLFRPKSLKAQESFLLSMAVSLAVCRSLQQFVGQRVSIKWPNDILAERRKITGILVENSLKGGYISDSIIGIGLNAYQKSPPLPTATSIAQHCEGKLPETHQIVSGLIDQLDHYLNILEKPTKTQLRQEYHRLMAGYGERLLFESEGRTFEALVMGVNEQGQLRLREGDREKTYYFKGLRWLNLLK